MSATEPDGRRNNGGARPGSGPKKGPPGERWRQISISPADTAKLNAMFTDRLPDAKRHHNAIDDVPGLVRALCDGRLSIVRHDDFRMVHMMATHYQMGQPPDDKHRALMMRALAIVTENQP